MSALLFPPWAAASSPVAEMLARDAPPANARQLAKSFSPAELATIPLVHRGVFLDALRLDDVRMECERRKRLVLSGVRLLDVMDRLGLELAALVYVRRWNANGWIVDDELFDDSSATDAAEAYDPLSKI